MFAIIQAAGWPIWWLLIASVIATALIIERLVYLRRACILSPQLLQEMIRVYYNGKINDDLLTNLASNSPLGKVLSAGLRNVDASRELMKESIEEVRQAAAHEIERFLNTLGTIASLAPLMGLFGTVVGMIEIFGATNGAGADRAQLGNGISVALYNTGFGLTIDIFRRW